MGLRTEGTLAVAFNSDDRAALDRLTDFRTGLGLSTERLSGAAARALEPYLAAGVRGGVLAADDLSVDNRRYLRVLRGAAEAVGVALRHRRGHQPAAAGGATRSAESGPPPGTSWRAGTVVLCGGAATGALLPVPVQPVKGQILRLAVPERLRAAGPVLTRTVRGIVRGSEIYLVPRAGGEVVVGATSEQQGHDTQRDRGRGLRAAAQRLRAAADQLGVQLHRGPGRLASGHPGQRPDPRPDRLTAWCWPPGTTATASCCRR